MGKLEELKKLAGEEEKIDIPEDVPEESEGRVELVQPAVYVFKLPDNMSDVWGVFDSKKGKRIYASFNRENAITVVKDEKYEKYFDGFPVNLLINNLEYPRGAERVEVADMTYLIKSLYPGEKVKLDSNAAFADMLAAKAGAYFKAELSWNAYCNPNKPIYQNERDEEGKVIQAKLNEELTGCGKSYNSYSRDPFSRIPSYDNNGFEWFYERFEERDVHGEDYACPAVLFANARLGRFKTVKASEVE